MSDILSSYNSFGKLNIVTEASSTIPQLVFDLIDTSKDDNTWKGDRISFAYTSGATGSNHFRITENSFYAGDKANFDLIGDNNVLYNDLYELEELKPFTGVKGTSNNLFIYSDRNLLNLSSKHNTFINSKDNELNTYNVSGVNFINSNKNKFNKFYYENNLVPTFNISLYKSDENFIRGSKVSANGVTFINSNNNYYASDDSYESQKVLINTNHCIISNDSIADRNLVTIGNDCGYINNSNNIIAIGKGLYCSNKDDKIILGQFNKNPDKNDIFIIGDGTYPNIETLVISAENTNWNDDSAVEKYKRGYVQVTQNYRHNIFTVNSDGYIQINANQDISGNINNWARYSFSGIKYYDGSDEHTIVYQDLYNALQTNAEVNEEYQNQLNAITAQLTNITNYIPSYFPTEVYDADVTPINISAYVNRAGYNAISTVADKTILLIKNPTENNIIINYNTSDSFVLSANKAVEFIKNNTKWILVS